MLTGKGLDSDGDTKGDMHDEQYANESNLQITPNLSLMEISVTEKDPDTEGKIIFMEEEGLEMKDEQGVDGDENAKKFDEDLKIKGITLK